jgi:redox-sensitive bicupin YhaK (pirin superfamily)
MSQPRRVTRLVRGMPTSDGAGVRLTRVIGIPELRNLDPFLMLDHFGSEQATDYIAGFPNHPHRGFETVTYMLEGRMRHRDNQGNEGLLTSGSVQWMTAGRGLIHSEMPEQEEGRMSGFQLWINLPARDKMTAPRYQDIAPERIPEVEPLAGAKVRVLAGEFAGVRGPVDAEATSPLYLDIALPAGASLSVPVPSAHTAFAYVFEGKAALAGQPVSTDVMALLSEGDSLEVAALESAARLILVAGRPLREPIVQHGPFVMNHAYEIHQAIADYQAGKFGPLQV